MFLIITIIIYSHQVVGQKHRGVAYKRHSKQLVLLELTSVSGVVNKNALLRYSQLVVDSLMNEFIKCYFRKEHNPIRNHLMILLIQQN